MHLSTFFTPPADGSDAPLLLTVPGLGNSGPAHWQSHWEVLLPDCERAELGDWDQPDPDTWLEALNEAIEAAERPVILIAHSLGCHAVARWAQRRRPNFSSSVAGALLVAPPELDHAALDPRLLPFAPASRGILPFPSIVVASQNDPYIDPERAKRLAFFWGSEFADAGKTGHINAESGLGTWDFGQFLLRRLIRKAQAERTHAHDVAFHPAAPPSLLSMSI